MNNQTYEPFKPPFRYRPDFADICDARSQKMLDIRGWGHLTGAGALNMGSEEAAAIQNGIGERVAKLVTEDCQPAEGGKWV
jgi:hypothetical protein